MLKMEENLLQVEELLSQLKTKHYNMLFRIKTPKYRGFYLSAIRDKETGISCAAESSRQHNLRSDKEA